MSRRTGHRKGDSSDQSIVDETLAIADEDGANAVIVREKVAGAGHRSMIAPILSAAQAVDFIELEVMVDWASAQSLTDRQ